MKPDGLHVSGIKGNPIEVKSLDIVDCVLQERVTRGDSHECVIETDGESRWGDPVDGEEEVHWLEALYVEIKVYATHFVENQGI
jgi:hypothetical protein